MFETWLDQAFVVREDRSPSPPLPRHVERVVETLWDSERALRPGLFDAPILSLVRRSEHDMWGRFVPYRYYLAQKRRAELFDELHIQPLAVSGMVWRGDDLLWGRRSKDVTDYPDWWELIPSGAISADCVRSDGHIDFRHQLVKELFEELGVRRSMVSKLQPFVAIMDETDHVVDLCAELTIHGDALSDLSSGEYSNVLPVAADDLPKFLNSHRVVPVSRRMCELSRQSSETHLGARTRGQDV